MNKIKKFFKLIDHKDEEISFLKFIGKKIYKETFLYNVSQLEGTNISILKRDSITKKHYIIVERFLSEKEGDETVIVEKMLEQFSSQKDVITFLKENGYESIQQNKKDKEHYIKMENSLFWKFFKNLQNKIEV